MKSVILSFSIAILAVTSAGADPIADRKAIMKERGGLVGQLAPIAKGEQPYDAAKVDQVFAALKANADKFDVDALFPADSKTGDTKASPKIWEDMAGFKAADGKFRADAAAAAEAKPADIEAFRVQFGKVTGNCGACHQAWRL